MYIWQTLTKTTDNPNVPPTFSVMSGMCERWSRGSKFASDPTHHSEYPDVSENVLKILGSLINDEKIRPYFRSLSVSLRPPTSLETISYAHLPARSLISQETVPVVQFLPTNARDTSF